MRTNRFKSALAAIALAGVTAAVVTVTAWPTPAHAVNNCTAATNHDFATDIAHGHAFVKHHAEFVHGTDIAGLAFPLPTIGSAAGFAVFLEGILNAPTADKALANNRHGYWDATTGTVIITNLKPLDCGTAFRPTSGMTYYDNLN
ncbi:hypothetical protein [Roseibium aggregatum]|uniref:Uncharacterized protein n=1 Tax=Roseibium aggregatum TaxID=187304 RepID=A0A939EF18_9HYPH|nr:hypothetical protein [Roseibium aggregatum]MBN9671317.1 hypothetical protein [Roseibium aggregatum]